MEIIDNSNYIKENIIFKEKIGSGSYSMVFKAFHKRLDIEVAVKVVNKNNTIRNSNDRRFIDNEVKCILSMQHPNIVKCYEVLEDINSFYFVMEFINGDTLLNHINEHEGLSEPESAFLFREILKALQYLHMDMNIIHRDIKLENIMWIQKGENPEKKNNKKINNIFSLRNKNNNNVSDEDNDTLYSANDSGNMIDGNNCDNSLNNLSNEIIDDVNDNDDVIISDANERNKNNDNNTGCVNSIKIIDFGFARQIANQAEICTTLCGSLAYTSPEMLKDRKYTVETDIWSLGVCLYGMVNGTLPFQSDSMSVLMDSIVNAPVEYPENVSGLFVDLCSHLLEKNPEQRYTLSEILMHPWVNRNTKCERRRKGKQNLCRSLGRLPPLNNCNHVALNSDNYNPNSANLNNRKDGEASIDGFCDFSNGCYTSGPLSRRCFRSSKMSKVAQSDEEYENVSSALSTGRGTVRLRTRLVLNEVRKKSTFSNLLSPTFI